MNRIKKYKLIKTLRKSIVSAVLFDGSEDSIASIIELVGKKDDVKSLGEKLLIIFLDDRRLNIPQGDYIIKSSKGRIWNMDKHLFKENFRIHFSSKIKTPIKPTFDYSFD